MNDTCDILTLTYVLVGCVKFVAVFVKTFSFASHVYASMFVTVVENNTVELKLISGLISWMSCINLDLVPIIMYV